MRVFVERDALLDLLNNSRAASQSVVQQLDPDVLVNNRRLADGLAHLALWEHYATLAIAAHHRGEHYVLAADCATINATSDQQHRQQLALSLVAQWHSQRATLCAAIRKLDWQRYHQTFTTCWGTGFIGDLVKALIAHEQTHVREVCAAVGRDAPYDQWGE